MVPALYRRYRPETFAELIGQSQVTDPLQTALRADRANHAYLFSGPRGCGKTTSARILARCLNCAEGPTDTPCGSCASCVELARDGGGSLDVVEIDAASHNGVDDARDLRERAVFAPARDRYKIFILDEAHMVTTQGFNALLKIVEEPPEHVKFIFATTEPEKVIGTIRSRTHHYPFRLVPPAQMLEYLTSVCQREQVEAEPGVLPLVVRAGGGSVRDTLSLLDQLMAGSEEATIAYDRAVALLGYTHSALLDDAVDALADRDPAAAFGAVDRVIQTGQDPRRFVEDVLERLRDLIIVAATSGAASSVLRGVPDDQLERMARQTARFGPAELSRAADVANSALSEMTGATSPRMHLELMVARMLIPNSDATERGTLARVERLERRIGVDAADTVPARPVADRADAVGTGAAPMPEDSRVAGPEPVLPVTTAQLRDAWPQVLEAVRAERVSAWTVVYTAQVRSLDGDILALTFNNQNDVDTFRQPLGAGDGVSDILRRAILAVLGVRVKFTARAEAMPHPALETSGPDEPSTENAGGWAVAEIPIDGGDAPADPRPTGKSKSITTKVAKPVTKPVTKAAPKANSAPTADGADPANRSAPLPASASVMASARYGESVVRELLGANFIEEQQIEPRATPRITAD